jgi:hypothetical protein
MQVRPFFELDTGSPNRYESAPIRETLGQPHRFLGRVWVCEILPQGLGAAD